MFRSSGARVSSGAPVGVARGFRGFGFGVAGMHCKSVLKKIVWSLAFRGFRGAEGLGVEPCRCRAKAVFVLSLFACLFLCKSLHMFWFFSALSP